MIQSLRSVAARFGTGERRATAPRPRNSTWEYREAVATAVSPSTRWLDLGCGHQLLPRWMHDGEEESRRLVGRSRLAVGTDRLHEALRRHASIDKLVVADTHQLPFLGASFDLVTANMLVEHVDDGARLLAEVGRVLAPGGIFLFHTPHRHYYQILLSLWVPSAGRRRAASLIDGRAATDVFPTRYRMNTRPVLLSLAKEHGFAVDRLTLLTSSLTFGRWAPAAMVERAILRLLDLAGLEWGRSNVIAVLRKKDERAP